MPLPIAHGLLGAAVVAAIYPTPAAERGWTPLLWGAVLANCPDLDFLLLWGLQWRGVHRGFTHSIAFSVVAGCAIWWRLGRARGRAALAYGSALLSHTLVDYATSERGGGVILLWPVSWERYKLGALSFSEYPHGFSAAEVLVWGLIEAGLFLTVLLAVLAWRGWFSAARSGRGAI